MTRETIVLGRWKRFQSRPAGYVSIYNDDLCRHTIHFYLLSSTVFGRQFRVCGGCYKITIDEI